MKFIVKLREWKQSKVIPKMNLALVDCILSSTKSTNFCIDFNFMHCYFSTSATEYNFMSCLQYVLQQVHVQVVYPKSYKNTYLQ